VEIFSHPDLADNLAFRGGKADFVLKRLANLIPGEPWQGKIFKKKGSPRI
jgi:hypothetical protein